MSAVWPALAGKRSGRAAHSDIQFPVQVHAACGSTCRRGRRVFFARLSRTPRTGVKPNCRSSASNVVSVLACAMSGTVRTRAAARHARATLPNAAASPQLQAGGLVVARVLTVPSPKARCRHQTWTRGGAFPPRPAGPRACTGSACRTCERPGRPRRPGSASASSPTAPEAGPHAACPGRSSVPSFPSPRVPWVALAPGRRGRRSRNESRNPGRRGWSFFDSRKRPPRRAPWRTGEDGTMTGRGDGRRGDPTEGAGTAANQAPVPADSVDPLKRPLRSPARSRRKGSWPVAAGSSKRLNARSGRHGMSGVTCLAIVQRGEIRRQRRKSPPRPAAGFFALKWFQAGFAFSALPDET